MPTYIALLRAINLGPHQKVAMADLRTLLTAIWYEDPRTLILSGNLDFRAPARASADVERTLAAACAARLKVDTDVFVRTPTEWRTIIDGNPFPAMAKDDPGRLVLVCLRTRVRADDVAALQASITGRELVRSGGRHLYLTYPDGSGVSKVTLARIEKALGTRGTGRNWNTVLKIGALAADVLAKGRQGAT